MKAPCVSVIFGTYNRFAFLKRAVESIRSSVKPYSYEIVITDGGSTDGSLEWMRAQADIVIAETGNLRGAVSAFNAAWAASIGGFVANFNDDAEYVGDALCVGVQELQRSPSVGQVAFEFDLGGSWHHEAVCGLVYANFGVGPRDVIAKVCEKQGGPKNYWSPFYHTYAGDTEHSMWVWNLGYRVEPLKGARVCDRGKQDDLRRRNDQIRSARGDSYLFRNRWTSTEQILKHGTVKR